MNLFVAELRRFRKRPAIRRTLLLVAVAGLIVPTVTFLRTTSREPAGPGDPNFDAAVATCRRDSAPFVDASDLDVSCAQDARFQFPDRRFCPTRLLDSDASCSPPTDSVDELGGTTFEVALPDGSSITAPRRGLLGSLAAVGVLLTLVAAALGSTFVGAEHRHGTYEAALVAEPRRVRLLAARFAAGVVGIVVGIALVVAVFLLGYLPAAIWHAAPGGLPEGYWSALALECLRIVAAAAAMGVLGMGIAAATRHTAAGIVGVFGVLVGATVLGLSVLPAVAPWDPVRNLVSIIGTGEVAQYRTIRDVADGGSGYRVEIPHHGPVGASMVIGADAALGIIAAFATLRRDVD